MTTYTHTQCGKFITKSAIELHYPNVPQGTMIAALLETGNDFRWCLFYEQGGDWNCFEDGEQYDSNCVDQWMPDAVISAIKELSDSEIKDMDALLTDMEWFEDWAVGAKSTIQDAVND